MDELAAFAMWRKNYFHTVCNTGVCSRKTLSLTLNLLEQTLVFCVVYICVLYSDSISEKVKPRLKPVRKVEMFRLSSAVWN